MNGDAIKQFFLDIIDETSLEAGEDFIYDLMTHAKDVVESGLDLEILKKLDSSNSVSAGDTVDTPHSLPSDFYAPLIQGSLFVDTKEHVQVPYEQKQHYKSASGYFLIDYVSGKYYLTGEQCQAGTIYFWYFYATGDMAARVTPVWPAKFHKLIAFIMAELYEAGLDSDDLSYRMSAEQKNQKQVLWDAMVRWNARLQLAAMNGRARRPSIDYSSAHNIIDID